MTDLRVLGLDLSLTCTGIAGITDDSPWADHITTGLRGHDRLAAIRTGLREHTADLWVIEGLAYDAHDTERAGAGLHWIIRHALWRRGQRYVLIPPATLKKYATGNGAASKEDMLLAAERAFPGAHVAGNDEADALWLAHAGRDRYGAPTVRIPAPRRALLTAVKKGRPVIDWPALDSLAVTA